MPRTMAPSLAGIARSMTAISPARDPDGERGCGMRDQQLIEVERTIEVIVGR